MLFQYLGHSFGAADTTIYANFYVFYMTTLVLMRHGETEWNRMGRQSSRTDISINERGAAEVRAVAPALESFASAFFVSSPLNRAKETAAIVAAILGVENAQTWESLREIDAGVFEGETHTSALQGPYAQDYLNWRDLSSANVGAPLGETWAAVDERARNVLESLEKQDRDALVIGHGCFIRAILAHAVMGLPSQHLRRFRLDNASFIVLSKTSSNWVVTGCNVRAIP